jgi:cytochrome c-type biogenesis protein CcmH
MTPAVRRWLPLGLLGVVLVGALIIGTTTSSPAPTVADRVHHITARLRCPVCSGETVADSAAPISADIRTAVAERVVGGQSDGQITAYIVHQYPGTLLTPPTSGVGLIVWLLPVLAFLAAAGLLALAFARWRARPAPAVTADDRALVEAELRR